MEDGDADRPRRVPTLVLLGGGDDPCAPLEVEGHVLEPGDRVPLVRRRSRWDDRRDIVRVVIGTHSTRADVRVQGDGVKPEHIRLYHPLRGEGSDDFRPLQNGTGVNGRPLAALEYVPLQPGDEITFLAWRFRYEVEWRSGEIDSPVSRG